MSFSGMNEYEYLCPVCNEPVTGMSQVTSGYSTEPGQVGRFVPGKTSTTLSPCGHTIIGPFTLQTGDAGEWVG